MEEGSPQHGWLYIISTRDPADRALPTVGRAAVIAGSPSGAVHSSVKDGAVACHVEHYACPISNLSFKVPLDHAWKLQVSRNEAGGLQG